MDIGNRLRSVRQEKNLSQGDIEQRTGLLRCYISRVENGHTVPAIETLEKMARALELPLYQLMYDGQEPPALPLKGDGKRPDVLPCDGVFVLLGQRPRSKTLHTHRGWTGSFQSGHA